MSSLLTREPGALSRWPIARMVPRPDTAAVIAIVLIASTVFFTNLTGPAFQDDEGTYTAQALSLEDGDLAPYTYWYDHPPVGWIQLAALIWIPRVFGLGDGIDIATMRYVIALYFVANAVLIYLIARRIEVTRTFALLGVAAFVFSPLSLGLGRQVFLDTIALPWLLLAFYLALSPRMALWSHAAAGASFAIAVLSKLTAAVMGPALLVALVDRRAWQGRMFSVMGFLTIGALVLAFYPLMALLRGELVSGEGHVSLQDGLTYQFTAREGSGYVWEAGSARSELLVSWAVGDGFLVVGGAIAAALCLASRRTRWVSVAVGSFFVPVIVGEGYLPSMYIVAGIPFLCIALAAAADLVRRAVLRLGRDRLPNKSVATPIVLAAVTLLLLAQAPVVGWVDKNRELLSSDQNGDWRSTLEWMSANVPRDEVVLTPYSMWHDLDSRGWNDTWTMIALEKADLDPAYEVNHPTGWREIEWVIEGPTVQSNLEVLGLTTASTALQNSEIVRSFGAWNIRRVETDAIVEP